MADFTEMVALDDTFKMENSIVSNMDNANSYMWISFNPDESDDNRKKAFNASTEDGTSMMDCNGKVIKMKDALIIPVTITSSATGEEIVCPRVILLCEDGTYTATSWGAYRSLQKLNALMKGLHFEEGLMLKIEVVKTKKGKTINFKIA